MSLPDCENIAAAKTSIEIWRDPKINTTIQHQANIYTFIQVTAGRFLHPWKQMGSCKPL